jgi:hypothetical protein
MGEHGRPIFSDVLVKQDALRPPSSCANAAFRCRNGRRRRSSPSCSMRARWASEHGYHEAQFVTLSRSPTSLRSLDVMSVSRARRALAGTQGSSTGFR